MKVLMISGDRHILEAGSPARARFHLQRNQVELLDVFVWPQVDSKWAIWWQAQKIKYDVITAQDPFWRGLLAWKIARLTGAQLNVQVHTDLSAQSFVRHMLARIVLRHADSIRVVSDKLKAQVEHIGARAPIHVLPIFVDVEPFKALTRKEHDGKIILWVGRFEEEKDPMAALSVLEHVKKECGDVRLIMLGTGALVEALRKKAEGLAVEFPGWQDPEPFFETADVVLSTSKHESWGASMVEALAAGVPVVAPDVGIAKEVGAVVVPRAELSRAVIDVLKSDTQGKLALPMPTAEEWSKRWGETLI